MEVFVHHKVNIFFSGYRLQFKFLCVIINFISAVCEERGDEIAQRFTSKL